MEIKDEALITAMKIKPAKWWNVYSVPGVSQGFVSSISLNPSKNLMVFMLVFP